MINEAWVLVQYAWTRNRNVMIVLFSLVALGETIALFSTLFPLSESGKAMVMTCLGFTLGPCLLYSLVLFQCSSSANLANGDSGYDPWLMRLPITTVRLTLIPIGMLTIWITILWGIFVATVRLVSGHSLPFIPQVLALSAVFVFILSLVWRPWRSAWQRPAVLILLAPILYMATFICLAISDEKPQFNSIVVIGVGVGYVATIIFSLHCIKLARVSANQQILDSPIRALGTRIVDWFRPKRGSCDKRSFASQYASLRWHDARRSRSSLWRISGVFILPMMLIVASIPIDPQPAIVCIVLAGAMASIATTAIIEPSVWARKSSLPTYLVASPLHSRTIAWSRLVFIATTFVRYFVIASLIALLAWLFFQFPGVQSQWRAMVQSGDEAAALVRMIAVLVLSILILFLGISLRYATLQMQGQSKLSLALTTIGFLVALTPGMAFLGWFLRQTNWEFVQATIKSWLGLSMPLLYALCVVKLATAMVAIQLQIQHGTSLDLVAKVIAGWGLAVFVSSVCLWCLCPSEWFSYPYWLLGTVLAVPFSPLLLSPLAVDSNRHRGN